MAKKRHYMQRKQSHPPRGQGDTRGQEPVDRRALEKSIFDLTRHIRGKQFEGMEDLNAYLQGMMADGEVPSPPDASPLEEAQSIMYDAWSVQGPRRIRLARKALSTSPDCADAYVLLAEETAHSLEQARDLYTQGVAAGERALGPDAFEKYAEHFWGAVETRPYMRARAGLATSLMQMGEYHQAIEHYRELLRLNPGDNQGIRYILAPLYLDANEDAQVLSLLGDFEDDTSAIWLYTRALWVFRLEAASKEATRYLETAIQHNPFVPPYLLGTKKLPQHGPVYMGRGDEDEAVAYALRWRHQWTGNREALNWLRETDAARNP